MGAGLEEVGREIEGLCLESGRLRDLHILFWNVTSLILSGVKSVGGLGVRAEPAAGDWMGV